MDDFTEDVYSTPIIIVPEVLDPEKFIKYIETSIAYLKKYGRLPKAIWIPPDIFHMIWPDFLTWVYKHFIYKRYFEFRRNRGNKRTFFLYGLPIITTTRPKGACFFNGYTKTDSY